MIENQKGTVKKIIFDFLKKVLTEMKFYGILLSELREKSPTEFSKLIFHFCSSFLFTNGL